MKIFEVESNPDATPSPEELLGLVEFLAGRAKDTDAPTKISQDAFISLAQSLGINVSLGNLEQVLVQPPLSNVVEPYDPSSGEIVFKGNQPQAGPEQMTADKAQNIVASAAKSASKRDRGV